ncbi:MAG: I78 family peptidase inhibitor [Pseudomonadota bacterium]
MRLLTSGCVLVTAAIISGCTVENLGGNSDAFLIPDPIDPCGARSVQFLVGKSENRLKGRRYAAPLRILRAGDVVDTKDVNPNRLTARVSAGGRIASLTCD